VGRGLVDSAPASPSESPASESTRPRPTSARLHFVPGPQDSLQRQTGRPHPLRPVRHAGFRALPPTKREQPGEHLSATGALWHETAAARGAPAHHSAGAPARRHAKPPPSASTARPPTTDPRTGRRPPTPGRPPSTFAGLEPPCFPTPNIWPPVHHGGGIGARDRRSTGAKLGGRLPPRGSMVGRRPRLHRGGWPPRARASAAARGRPLPGRRVFYTTLRMVGAPEAPPLDQVGAPAGRLSQTT